MSSLPGTAPVSGVELVRSSPVAGTRLGLATLGACFGIAALPVLTPIGPGNAAPVDAAMGVAMLCTLVWAGSTRQELRLPYGISVFLMAVVGMAAAVLGRFPSTGALHVGQDLYLLAWCACVANVMRTPRDTAVVLRVWAWAATCWGVAFVLFGWRTVSTTTAEGEPARVGLVFGEENGAALYFLLSLMVVLAARCPLNRAARTLAVGVLVASLTLTGSLAGMAGALAAVTVAILLRVLDRYGGAAMIAALVAVIVAAGGAVMLAERTDVVARSRSSSNPLIRNSIGRLEQSGGSRALLARQNAALYGSAGITGRGPGSTRPTLEAEQAPYPKEAHNDYIAALLERGAAGLFAVVLLLGAIAVRASAVRSRRQLSDVFGAVVPAPMFLVGGLFGLLVFSFTHEALHERSLWAFIALIAGLYLWARRRAEPERRGSA